MSETTSHWFGLPIPDGSVYVRAWGSRAIIRLDQHRRPVKRKGRFLGDNFVMNTVIEMVPDRSQYRGPDIEAPDSRAFLTWLDKIGLRELRKTADEMGLAPEDDIEVQVDHEKFHIRANPRRSYGYLYIIAWEE